MKNKVKYIIIMLLGFFLVGCSLNNQSNNPVIEIGQSDKFSELEINKAVNCLKTEFNLEACTLTKIYYDENKSNSAIEDYLKYGEGSETKVNPENIIVLLADFDVDNSGKNAALNPGERYTGYNFILIRDNIDSDWKINSYGY